MQSQRQARYQDVVATVITGAIHAVVVVFLLMNLRISGALNPEPVVAEAIPAEVIDEVAIRQELEQLAEEDRRRQRVEAERQARLARAEREAWINWPNRITPILAAELGIDEHTLFVALDVAVRVHLEELGEFVPKVDG